MPANHMPTPDQLVNLSLEFGEEFADAVQNYARAKPWKGGFGLRVAKLREFHEALHPSGSPALMIDIDVEGGPGSSGESRLNQDLNAIEMRGKISVVTYLYLHFLSEAIEAMQNRTFDGVEPMVRAMTIFSRVFPRSYAKLRSENGVFVAGGVHRDLNAPPVAAPSQAPALGTESTPQMLPAPQVIERPRSTEAKPDRTDEEIGEI